MRCLQIERFPLNKEYLRLPRELLDCCAAASARPTMSKDLVHVMQRECLASNNDSDTIARHVVELNSQHHDVTDQANDLNELIETMEEDNEPLKSNKELKDIIAGLTNIRENMSKAHANDVELHRRMTLIMDHLKMLQGPLDQLERTLPAIGELDGTVFLDASTVIHFDL
jgi:chromosome segregation ATPase